MILHRLIFAVYIVGWIYFGRRFAGWLVETDPNQPAEKGSAIMLGFVFGGLIWPIVLVIALVSRAYERGVFNVLISEPREKRLDREKQALQDRIAQLERETGLNTRSKQELSKEG